MSYRRFIYSAATMVAIAALVMTTVSCENYRNKPAISGKSTVMCDESFKNVLDDEIAVFEYTYKQTEIEPVYCGESEALDSLLNDKCNMIISYRELTEQQKRHLKSQDRAYRCRQIAVDGIAVITNTANDIDQLTMDNLRDIFSGKVTTWGQVFPTKLKNDSVKVVFDRNGSGAMHFIRDKFLAGKDFPIKFFAMRSSEDVFKAVMANKNAMGLVSVSWITSDLKGVEQTIDERVKSLESNNDPSNVTFTDKVKVMPICPDNDITGVLPYQAYLYDGSYPLYRPIYAIDASLGGVAHDFYVFITGTIGQKIILQTGIVPAAEPVRVVSIQ